MLGSDKVTASYKFVLTEQDQRRKLEHIFSATSWLAAHSTQYTFLGIYQAFTHKQCRIVCGCQLRDLSSFCMILICMVSGEELPSISVEGVRHIGDVKRSLRALHGFPLCMQELLHDGKCLKDWERIDAPMDLQLVLKAPCSGEEKHELLSKFASICDSGQPEAARLLFEAGVDKNLQNEDGTTDLMIAAGTGSLDIVRLLLEAGADTDLKDSSGRTVLMQAAENGYVEIARVILEAGANKDLQDAFGATALICAVDVGHVPVVQLLLEAGYKYKEMRDRHERTALMCAAHSGRVTVVQLLLKAGAQKDLQDENGLTALMYAALRATRRSRTCFWKLVRTKTCWIRRAKPLCGGSSQGAWSEHQRERPTTCREEQESWGRKAWHGEVQPAPF